MSTEPASRRVSSPVLVGRTAELDRLDGAWETARSGRSRLVVLAGEAGIGKSRLAAEWLARLGGDAAIATGRCLALDEGTLPFGPFAELVRGLIAAQGAPPTARFLPDLLSHVMPVAGQTTDDASGQARLYAAVATLVEDAAATRPTCLLLEDVHSLDHASLNLLRYLEHVLRRSAVLWILTLRTDDPTASPAVQVALAELVRNGSNERIDLGRFDRGLVGAQVEGIRGARPDPELVARIHDWSGGNPFFTEEVLALDLVGGRPIPPSSRDMLLSRVAPSSAEVETLLRAAAVGGSWVARDDLAGVTGLEAPALWAALRAVVESHLLIAEDRAERDGFTFRHALVREAVASDLLTAERRDLHARWAATLERVPHGRETAIAEHWDRAGRPDRAAPAYVAAADAAARTFARSDAARLLERAVGLADATGAPIQGLPARLELLEAAALQHEFAGERDRAIELLLAAIADVPAEDDRTRGMRLRRRVAEISGQRAHGTLSMRAIGEAMAQVGDEPDAEGAAVIAAYAMRLGLRGDLEGARAAADRAVATAHRVGASVAEARGLQVLAQLRSMEDVDAGVAGLRAAAALAAEAGDLDVRMEALNDVSWALANAGRYAAALEAIEEVYATSLAAGVSGEIMPIYRARRIEYLTLLGRWLEAEADIEAVETSRAWTARFRASTLRSHQGRGDDAARFIADALRLREVDDPDVPDRGGVAIARSNLALCHRDPSAALEIVREAIPLPGEEHMEAELLALAVRACGIGADTAPRPAAREAWELAAEPFVARLAELEARRDHASWRPIAAQLLLAGAESERIAGRSDAEAWRTAGDAWLGLGVPERVAEARYREAEALLLGGAGRARADAALREAATIAAGLAATPLRAEIEGLALRARIRLEGDDDTGRTAEAGPTPVPADPHGLSARERDVLRLLVTGRTNREIGAALFISPKTAGVHVSNILGKLGVVNRVEAATVAHRLGLVAPDRPTE